MGRAHAQSLWSFCWKLLDWDLFFHQSSWIDFIWFFKSFHQITNHLMPWSQTVQQFLPCGACRQVWQEMVLGELGQRITASFRRLNQAPIIVPWPDQVLQGCLSWVDRSGWISCSYELYAFLYTHSVTVSWPNIMHVKWSDWRCIEIKCNQTTHNKIILIQKHSCKRMKH